MATKATRRRWPRALRPRYWLMGLVVLVVGVLIWQKVAGLRSSAQEAQAATQGSQLFGLYCAPCHGVHMQGRPRIGDKGAQGLHKPGYEIFFAVLPDAFEGWVGDQIAQGNSVMPSFRSTLTPDQRRELALYIRMVNTGGAPAP